MSDELHDLMEAVYAMNRALGKISGNGDRAQYCRVEALRDGLWAEAVMLDPSLRD